jgi:enoyl-CoA hydratase/carnithine racemase
MSEAPVLYATRDYVATITLNRPENRNSMTPDVLEGFREAIARAREDCELRAVVITGSGKSFCAGADFRSAGRPGSQEEGDRRIPQERAFAMYQPFLAVLDIEVPTIAAMNGHAIGGGLGLALVCDLRIADVEAKYGANFARLGLHSGMAISYLLPRIVGVPTAADLLFSGRLVSGSEAERIGLAQRAVAASEVAAEAAALARSIAGCAPLAVRLVKRSLYRGMDWDPRSAAEAEAWAQSATLATDDAREGIAALLEKREPRFTGR